jgi:hypothetical protein
MEPDQVMAMLCECIAQPKIYRRMVDAIDYEKYGVYTFTSWNPETHEWRIPFTDGTTAVLHIRMEVEKG